MNTFDRLALATVVFGVPLLGALIAGWQGLRWGVGGLIALLVLVAAAHLMETEVR